MKGNTLLIDNIQVEVIRKKVKNINIRIKPPGGKVVVSVPLEVSMNTVVELIRSKIHWIAAKQSLLRQERKNHFALGNTDKAVIFQGHRYPVELLHTAGKSRLKLYLNQKIIFRINGVLSATRREGLINDWYRLQLQLIVPELLDRWLPIIGVDLTEWRIRRMKTRWGSCNIVKRRIWLNLELIKVPPGCLEYVVVHELVHLLEAKHNARFWGLVESFLPDWRQRRKQLRNWERCM